MLARLHVRQTLNALLEVYVAVWPDRISAILVAHFERRVQL